MGDLLSFLYTVVDTLSLIFFLDAFAQRRWDNWKFTLGIGCLVALNFWIQQADGRKIRSLFFVSGNIFCDAGAFAVHDDW